MNMFWLLSLTVSLAHSLRAVVFFSEFTTNSFLHDFYQATEPSKSSIEAYNISDTILNSLEDQPVDLLFDFTYSISHEVSLQTMAFNLKIPYFTPKHPAKCRLRKYIFHLHQPTNEGKAIEKLLKELKIDKYFLISDASRVETASELGAYHLIPSISPQKTYDDYVSRVIKTSGNWKIVVLSDARGSQKAFQSTKNSKIYENSMVFIAVGRGTLSKYQKGVIEITEEGLEEAESEGQYEGLAVLKVLSVVKTLSPINIASQLEEMFQDHIIAGNYSVMNYKTDHSKEKVGKIFQSGIQMTANITYPGNPEVSNSAKPVLRISANLGLFDFDGTFVPGHDTMTKGLAPMVSIINSDDSLLKNYELELLGTDCGPMTVNYEHLRSCMRKYINELKGVYIDGIFDDVVIANMKVMKEYNVKIPHVSTFIEDMDLYNKELYPDLVITTPHFQHLYGILPYILKSFGWENIILFYNEFRLEHEIFLKNSEILGLKILNTHRSISGVLDLNNPNKYTHHFKEIVKSKCRIIVSIQNVPNNVYLAHLLYEFGFRRGDLVMVTLTRTTDVIDLNYLEHNKIWAREILEGSISMYYMEYVEEYGEKLKRQIEEYIYPVPTSYTCYMIDSLLIAVHTMQMLIDLEMDYEDPALASKFIRKQKFTGCSGKITIDSSGNGMGEIRYGIFNFFEDRNGNWTETYLGSYTLGTLVPLKLNRQIMWPNGSTAVPNDLIEGEGPCVNSTETNSVTFFIHMLLLGIGIAVSAVSIWWLFRVSVSMIENSRTLMFEDAVLLSLPLVEALQRSRLGGEFNPILLFAGSIAIYDLDFYLDSSADNFWRKFFLAFGIVLVWIICAVMCFTRVYVRSPEKIKDFLFFFVYVCFAAVTQYCFIPVVLTFLSIFECSDTLVHDCSIDCWESYHLALSMIVSFVLVLYIAAAVLLKVEIDDCMEAVNIKTNPVFHCLKSIFHLLLVSLYVMRPYYHHVFYFVCFVVWLGIVLMMKPYNYSRFNFWQKLIALGETINALLMLVREYTHVELEWIIGAQLGCFHVIGLFGLFLQWKHYPSLLYRKPGSNIHKLIKFAFNRGVTAKEITIQDFNYVDRPSPVVVEVRASQNG